MPLHPRALRLAVVAIVLIAPPAGADVEAEEERLAGLALDRMIEGQTRIMRVADRIRVAGLAFCKKEVGPVLGAYAADRYSFRDLFGDRDYARPFIETASARFDLRKEPRVLAVVPGSPADAAGLRQGDLVTAIAGKKVRKGIQLDGLPRKYGGGALTISVKRQEGGRTVRVRADNGCAFPSRYFFGPVINAFAVRFGNLTGMYVSDGMLEFVPSDDELAFILGHELAHFVLKHHGTLRGSRQFEADADYLGLYVAARAGFDVDVAPGLQDRITRMNPLSTIDWGVYSHPNTADRALALRAALEEIRAKLDRGEALEPETR